MTFNWFNRLTQKTEPDQTSESAPSEAESTSAEQTETEQTDQEETPSEPIAPETPEPNLQSDDQLKFAKAAYETIKKRQAEAAQRSGTVTKDAAEDVVEDVVEEPPTAAIAETDTEISAALEDPTTEPILAESTVEPAVESTPPEPTVSLPFWMQQDYDRQQRLERLQATAIETPETSTPSIPTLDPVSPTPTASPTPDTSPAPDRLDLDEGFLWSTEVLAAMGRRAEDVTLEEITWLRRLRQGLDKTRRNLVNRLKSIVGQGPLNEDAVLEIESLLLQADAGVEATDKIIAALQTKLRQETLPPEQAIAYLKQILRDLLDQPNATLAPSLKFAPNKDTLNIWLLTGVNGAGKTTTIGKLAHIAQKSGYTCLIAAADTFRAAAVEQVKVWGQRSGVEVIANPGKNTDPAAVVFDAITAAQSRGTELLLVDTAGRLQNKKNLMDELSKVRRIIDRKAETATIESLLVLDATLGQNGLRQAQVFAEAAQLSGVVLTKLDGTAKGGIALAVVEQLGLPIRFIGAGEGIEDLRPFSSYEFVEALISG